MEPTAELSKLGTTKYHNENISFNQSSFGLPASLLAFSDYHPIKLSSVCDCKRRGGHKS